MGTVMQRFVLAAAFMLGLSSANAQTSKIDNTHDLYEACQNDASPTRSLCAGYIMGVGDMMFGLGLVYKLKPDAAVLLPFAICGELNHAAMAQAFVNWAKANPQKWSDDKLFGVMSALSENWPCK